MYLLVVLVIWALLPSAIHAPRQALHVGVGSDQFISVRGTDQILFNAFQSIVVALDRFFIVSDEQQHEG